MHPSITFVRVVCVLGEVAHTHFPEGFGLCVDIQIDCDGEGTAQSHDLSRHTLGLDTSPPSSLDRGWCDLDGGSNE